MGESKQAMALIKPKTDSSAPTALIVDDDETLRYTLARISKLAGFEVHEVSSGEEALGVAQDSFPDVVVSDVKLQDFDGFELCRRLKSEETTRNIPVILVTSIYYKPESSPKDVAAGRARAKALGALELMPRGETMDHLVPLLRELRHKKIQPRSILRYEE
jgi:CheY-like chemotaxis protein